MRDLVFKNLTSSDKKKKIIVSSELIEYEGIRTSICRHFLCKAYVVEGQSIALPCPSLYIIKKKNTAGKSEAFYCRIKGKMYLANEDKLFLINFIHSLKIHLRAITQGMTG